MRRPFKNLGQAVPARESNPGHSCSPWVSAILTKFALNSANSTFGHPERAALPCHGTADKNMVPQNFRNHFSRAKISPRFGFVPSNPKSAKRAGEKFSKKKKPQGRSYCPWTPATDTVERWCDPNDSTWETDGTLSRAPSRRARGSVHYCKPL